MKINIDTLLLPRWVVPVEPHNVTLEEHALAIHDGKIVALLPVAQALLEYAPAKTVTLADHVVMPGFVNAHTHSPMSLFRGLADDLPLMTWLNDHVWPAERKWLDEVFVRDGTELAMLEMLRSGTTCFSDHFFFPAAIAAAANAANMRAVVGGTLIKFSNNYANNATEHFTQVSHFCQQWKNHPLIKPIIAPHAPYTVDDETFLQIKEFTEQHEPLLHIHLHETADEIQQSLTEYGKTPLKRLYDLGLVSPQLICVHMTQLTDEDMAILAEIKPPVVHCPESNMKLASGFCPVKKLMNIGVNVALGTDGAASNNDLDMFGEMRTAALIAKGITQDPTALNATDALEMATINGAKALGLAHEIGSLLPGKSADLIAVNLAHANTQPAYHPISHLVYAVNSRQVTDVWIAGKQLLKNSEFTELDETAILTKARGWQQRILKG